MTADLQPGGREKLPEWFPPWAAQLADLYFSGTTAAFVLHGNTYDYVRSPRGETDEHVGLAQCRRCLTPV